METEDRLRMREQMDRTKQLEYLSSVENERNRVSAQIEQLRRQIANLSTRKIELDKEWREGILSVQATQCKAILEPKKSKKIDPRKEGLSNALQKASPEKLAKVAALLKAAGLDLDI